MYAPFYGKLWRPSQLIFIKGNRDGLNKLIPNI